VDTVLLLNVPIYETNQAANCLYDTLMMKLKEACYSNCQQIHAHFSFGSMTGSCLVLFVSWVDDFLVMGHPEDVQKVEDDISGAFGAKSEGELKEYVCCKIDLTHCQADGLRTIKIPRNLFWCKSLRMNSICLWGRRHQLLLLMDKFLCEAMEPEHLRVQQSPNITPERPFACS
jgi:hypothetical protein